MSTSGWKSFDDDSLHEIEAQLNRLEETLTHDLNRAGLAPEADVYLSLAVAALNSAGSFLTLADLAQARALAAK